jgi:hypothetical protein
MIDPSLFSHSHHVLSPSCKVDLNDFRYWNLAYGLYGEDLVLRGLLKEKLKSGLPGFYVDLGCAYALLGSNTALFYRYGWRGVCVDANPSFGPEYAAIRPRDTFVNCALGNGAEAYWARHHTNVGMSRMEASPAAFGPDFDAPVKLQTQPLSEVLNRHVPVGMEIDIMSVDLEGTELAVLRTSDWERFRPKFIVIEVDVDASTIDRSMPLSFLREHGYRVVSILSASAVLANQTGP